MIRVVVSVVALALVGVGGWFAGTLYPAPPALVSWIDRDALEERALAGLHAVDWAGLAARLTPEQREDAARDAVAAEAAAGQIIVVERADEAAIAELAPDGAATVIPAAATAPAPATAAPGAGPFEATLSLCPRMTVSNAPPADAARVVTGYQPLVEVRGVALASYPTRGACLSSGFGPRNGRPHRGVDYHAADGGPILAAADGVVLEKKYRDDFGNMLLIDHGGGVYTRYAHLSSFARDVAIGGRVTAGQVIGLMGNTAGYALPIHLHYEVLVGDYANPKASFGLEPVNPLAAPRAD